MGNWMTLPNGIETCLKVFKFTRIVTCESSPIFFIPVIVDGTNMEL